MPTGSGRGSGEDSAPPPSCRPPPPDGPGSSTTVDVDDEDEEEDLDDWLASEGEAELSDGELDRLLASPIGDRAGSPLASPVASPVATPKPNAKHAAELIEESPSPVQSSGSSGTAPAPEPVSEIMEIEESPLKTPVKQLDSHRPTHRSGSSASLESGEDSQVEKAMDTPPPRSKKDAVFQECTCGKPEDECNCFDTRHVKKQIAALKMQMAARTFFACKQCSHHTRTDTHTCTHTHAHAHTHTHTQTRTHTHTHTHTHRDACTHTHTHAHTHTCALWILVHLRKLK